MNNDNLKDFINSRRDEFDQRTPSKSVWRRIERSLFGSTTIDLWNSVAVWRAAAVVLLGPDGVELVRRREDGDCVRALEQLPGRLAQKTV